MSGRVASESSYSRRRLATVLSFALASAFSVGLVAVRVVSTDRPEGLNLVWNLFLAWIPFLLALVCYDAHRGGRSRRTLLVLGGLWLLFFPNAPYLVTDFKLLEGWKVAPVWFDVVVISAAAWTGLALGFASLYLIQAVIRRLAGAATSWLFVVCVLMLSSFGIYLGRFLRWNSWDVVAQPLSLLSDITEGLASPQGHGRTAAVTVLYMLFLSMSYAVFYSIMRLPLGELDER